MKRGRAFGWGFVSQGCSSATNFLLTLLAGRIGGPSGLGTVFLGFSAYLIILGLQRRLLSEPLVSLTAAAPGSDQARVGALGISAIIGSSVIAALGVAIAGVVIPGFVGDGLLLMAPWLAPALVQDVWRHLLFRDRRASAAAANDAVWLVVMIAAVPFAVSVRTDEAVMAAWGVGAVAAALIGFAQMRLRPAGPTAAWRWWWTDAWPFGRWNASAGIVSNVGSNATAFVVSGIIGSAALGGIRAAQSIFAPLTLVIPAIALPGLPSMGRALARSRHEAKHLALVFTAAALGATSLYLIAIALGGWRLLPALFGAEFLAYRVLIWPIAVAQLGTALGLGAQLLVKAQRRGRALLVARAWAAGIGLVLVIILAWRRGVEGAAWGSAAGAIVASALLIRAAWEGSDGSDDHDGSRGDGAERNTAGEPEQVVDDVQGSTRE